MSALEDQVQLDLLLHWLQAVADGTARYETSNSVLVGRALQADLVRCTTADSGDVAMALSWRGCELLEEDVRLRAEASLAKDEQQQGSA